ncbi:hypothetical protein PG996_011020 [Apiospora saccharicola]|uniref:Uncharacterized protein n=1 Tax=Apiospora saccharicola TaxID=335842 RepID=A0ABR1UDV3_9PEZI
MENPRTHSPASTEYEGSWNEMDHRSSTTLLSVQGSQRTAPNKSEPPVNEMPNIKETDTTSLHRPQSLWGLWWMEILNCLIMIGLLCAIISVLYPNNGEPLPDLPYHVSINTIVSILSTTLKASTALILAEGVSHLEWNSFQQHRLLNDIAILDKASRGPLGCLQLLVALARRGRQFAPLLAAALTILTLALDPFTRQLVRYYSCRQESGGRFPGIAAPVAGVINQGLFNPDSVTAPLFCPSGNCTFDPPFTTLGFCSICEDISNQLVISDELEKSTAKTTTPSRSFASYGALSRDHWFSMNSDLNDGTNNGSNWVDIIQESLAFRRESRPHGFHNASECGATPNNDTWSCRGFGGSGAARCKLSLVSRLTRQHLSVDTSRKSR